MKRLILLVLPALASCTITIDIQASNLISTTRIFLKGTDSNIISTNERITFGVTDENLKNAAEKYSGGKPQDVFLHSPTPWNDLYQTYGWRQVKRVFRPIRSKVLDVRSEEEIINLKELYNNSTATIYFNADMMQDVENTMSNTWSKDGSLTVEEPIFYNINFTLDSVTRPYKIYQYSSPWGHDGMEVRQITIGSDSDKRVAVEPGKSIRAELLATKVTMFVEVDYTASLNGHVACNYPKTYNGHYFWRYDVGALQEAGKLRSTVNSYEVIKIQYYSNPKMVITNKATKAIVSSFPGFMED